jgi:alpha-beta hydrolase superfamily lysophospholipase
MPVTAAAVVLAAAQVVSFRTADGWKLEASYRPAKEGRATVVLIHGVAASRLEWDPLPNRLAEKGVGTLAVDLRGHGGSTAGPKGPADFNGFTKPDSWTKMTEDLRAAAFWLRKQGVPDAKIAFGGASIGANLASRVAADRPATPFLLLLSPADDYRGVKLAARRGLKTFAAASLTDPRALDAVDALEKGKYAETATAARGHGAQMFEDPKFVDKLVAWTADAAGGK